MLTGENDSSGPGYYIDSSGQGPETGSVDIGAVAGTERLLAGRRPGRVRIRPYVIERQDHGSVIQIQPRRPPPP